MSGDPEVSVQQFISAWSGLERRRQIIVVIATVAMFVAILALSRMAAAPSMTLLYAGLESGAAGDVVRALEQRSVAFEVRGGSIFVDSRQRDQLRLTLASEGLPANSNRGYELLDNLTGFGTTSQMFDAAYWRAKEGELARTFVSSPHIAQARVHIATTGSNPFQRGVTPKASVSLMPSGAELTAAQAKAVRFLVASAVAGLAAEDVAVIDGNGALLGQSDAPVPAIGGDDKAQVLREKVQRLLEARVGFGNAIVEVSVDTVNESEAIRETRFDPDSRVAISTDTEERTGTSNDSGGGEVTVASNLPDQQEGDGEASSSQNSETRERINYEVSETEREIVRAPGAIKRVTVAVLVNEPVVTDANGAVTPAPREEEELDALRELVASAVGFDEARGDNITIKSMALLTAAPAGTPADQSLLAGMTFDVMSVIQTAVLALVALILGLFVVRPLLSRPAAPVLDETKPLALASAPENDPEVQSALSGEVSDGETTLPEFEVDPTFQPRAMDLPDISMLGDPVSDDPVERLRSMIAERQDETVEILRSWLEDTEESV
ncbi:flagellar basal-body MS-ring/collar protein FliF [Sulfitobacter aestuariivivens]|uniref:flagellar basal-body MS-ring/collar protein FliF n=1 Tax=Sulfitobacter aestuariivivens TaxID=2766981 RepID=UPI001C20E292|nr:flagellar basal-body MS-ring/collar protein FliF [Sulfitobacter aestuariivivens]